jgi:hypothetical protein
VARWIQGGAMNELLRMIFDAMGDMGAVN